MIVWERIWPFLIGSRAALEISRESKLLNVEYKDNNKDNIIPILKIISNKYKQYFKNNKKEFLKNSENYLNQQIIKFNQKTVRSLKKFKISQIKIN